MGIVNEYIKKIVNKINKSKDNKDKPWLKYYDENVLADVPPKTNMTEYIKKVTKSLFLFYNRKVNIVGNRCSYIMFFLIWN